MIIKFEEGKIDFQDWAKEVEKALTAKGKPLIGVSGSNEFISYYNKDYSPDQAAEKYLKTKGQIKKDSIKIHL